MNARPQLVRPADPGDDPIIVNYVQVRETMRGGGYYSMDQSVILLDRAMSPAARSFGESHLRFHARMRSVDDCAEADQVAATQLLPSVRLLEATLRACRTATEAAAELGVTVQALTSRISGIGELDGNRAVEMWCEVEWPADGEAQGFKCVVVDIESQASRRAAHLRMTA